MLYAELQGFSPKGTEIVHRSRLVCHYCSNQGTAAIEFFMKKNLHAFSNNLVNESSKSSS
jgi:hypothetical protein